MEIFSPLPKSPRSKKENRFAVSADGAVICVANATALIKLPSAGSKEKNSVLSIEKQEGVFLSATGKRLLAF